MVIPFISGAQSIIQPLNKTFQSLYAYSSTHKDVLSSIACPASLAQMKSFFIEAYGEQRYLLKDLNFYEGGVVIPTRSGNLSLNGSYMGFDAFNQSKLGIAFGRKFGKGVDGGLQFNYHAIRFDGYDNTVVINADLGVIIHLSDKLSAGWHLSNIDGRSLYNMQQMQMPVIYTMGIGYDVSSDFFWGGEVRKEEGQTAQINTAMHYSIDKKFSIGAGFSTLTSAVFFSWGLALKDLRLIVVSGYHHSLGITPGLILSYEARKNP